MSAIFLKNELSAITNTTESEYSLPSWFNSNNTTNNANTEQMSATSSYVPGSQTGGTFSATSYAAITNNVSNKTHTEHLSSTSSYMIGSQAGGAFSATSYAATESKNQVNELVSMLTSESSGTFNGLSETSTASLENQLRDILAQEGGAKKYKNKQSGGSTNVDDIRGFFSNLKNNGVNVDVKLNGKTMTEFFNNAENTTTEINTLNNKQEGGAKYSKKSKKSSKKSKKSKKSKMADSEMSGGINPGFQAFLDLKKFIAEKLKMPNGKDIAKVAGAVQREVKEKNPGLGAVEVAAKGRKHFEDNMEHFKQML